jgi:hypothetical protein
MSVISLWLLFSKNPDYVNGARFIAQFLCSKTAKKPFCLPMPGGRLGKYFKAKYTICAFSFDAGFKNLKRLEIKKVGGPPYLQTSNLLTFLLSGATYNL